MTGHVTNEHAGAIAIEARQQKEVSTDTLGRYQSRRGPRFGSDDGRLRQQLELQIVRQSHLPHELLPFDGRAHQRRVVHSRADLSAYGHRQLAIAGSERMTIRTTAQHKHAKRHRHPGVYSVPETHRNLVRARDADASTGARDGDGH